MPISEEKREPVRDIDTAVVDSLKMLDPNRPIREATEYRTSRQGATFRTCRDSLTCPLTGTKRTSRSAH